MTFRDMFGPSVLTNDGSMCFAWCYGVLVVDGLGLWLFSSLRPVLFAFFFLVSTIVGLLFGYHGILCISGHMSTITSASLTQIQCL